MSSSGLFKTKTVKIDTLGEYLAQVRTQLNLDLKTVSVLTQIKPSYLQLLEVGDYATLPPDVYIRGFLKSLARFYKIKEQLLIDQYEKERGFEVSKPRMQRQRYKVLFTPRTLVIGISLLLGIVAIGYVTNQIRSVLAPPLLTLSEPSADQTVTSDSVVVSGRAEIGAVVLINNQPVLIDSTGQFTENLLLSPGQNIVEIVEKNKFNKTSRITRQITSQPPTATPTAPEAVNLTIEIGPNSAWVYLSADGAVVQRGTMLPGSTKIVTAKNEIILTSANAGSTQVIYNDKDLGKLGREGEVIRNVQFSSQ